HSAGGPEGRAVGPPLKLQLIGCAGNRLSPKTIPPAAAAGAEHLHAAACVLNDLAARPAEDAVAETARASTFESHAVWPIDLHQAAAAGPGANWLLHHSRFLALTDPDFFSAFVSHVRSPRPRMNRMSARRAA